MKVGNILYRVIWDIGFGPSHRGWDEECTMKEDGCSPTFKVETWRVNTIRCKRRHKYRWSGRLGEKATHKTVFIRRFDHGHGVRMKTRWGKIVGFEFDKTRDRFNSQEFPLGDRPDVFRPTKKGAFKAAAAAIRKNYWYKKGWNRPIYERMRTRLLKQADKF